MKKRLMDFLYGTSMDAVLFCFAEGDDDADDKSGGGDGDGKNEGGGDDKAGQQQKDDDATAGSKSGLRNKGLGSAVNKDDGSNDDGKNAANDGRPEGLADKFWNAEKKEVNVAALIKSQNDTEKALGELRRSKGGGAGDVPKEASEYFSGGVTLDESVKNLKLSADDPGLKEASEVFLEEGIGKEAGLRIVQKIFQRMDKHAPPPINPDEELKALGKGGPALVNGLLTWADNLAEAGQLSADDIDVIEVMMTTANGARTLAKFRAMSGEQPIPIDVGGGNGSMSLEDINEAYKAAVIKKDYKEQARLDELRGRLLEG